MGSFFETIIQFFEAIFQFIENIVLNTIAMIQFVIVLPSVSTTIIGYVPGIISTSIVIVLAIGIIKLLLGWGNS